MGGRMAFGIPLTRLIYDMCYYTLHCLVIGEIDCTVAEFRSRIILPRLNVGYYLCLKDSTNIPGE